MACLSAGTASSSMRSATAASGGPAAKEQPAEIGRPRGPVRGEAYGRKRIGAIGAEGGAFGHDGAVVGIAGTLPIGLTAR